MFETASKTKLRFETDKGRIATEDLWDLPLTSSSGVSLDGLAKKLDEAVKKGGQKSFVTKRKGADATLELQFSIIKRVIKVRLDDADAKKQETKTKEQKVKILGIIADKEDGNLKDMSLKDLKKMVKKM